LDAATTGGADDITHITIWGAEVAGVCYFIDDVTDLPVFEGDSITIVVGNLSITFPVWT
jgi:hypothetical protein